MKLRPESISSPRVEMMPLIDIVFLLLVFFIYAMLSMVVHHGQGVDLPHSSQASVALQEAVPLTIVDRGDGVQLFVDKEPVALYELSKTLRDYQQASFLGEELEVQLFADRSVSYQELFSVMDSIKASGLGKISLQADVQAVTP